MNDQDIRVYGEDRDTLWRALLPMADRKHWTHSGGMARVEFAVAPGLGAVLARAMNRAEAQLLLEEAKAIGTSVFEERTPEQRRYDAFERVFDALVAATPLPDAG